MPFSQIKLSKSSRSTRKTGFGSESTRKLEKKTPAISRFGLDHLTGLLEYSPDPVVVQILEEVKFLPRDASLLIEAQQSLPPGFASMKAEDLNSNNFGLNTQKFAPMVS